MHPESSKAIFRKSTDLVRAFELREGKSEVRSFIAEINALIGEVLKTKSEWLDPEDIFEIFYHELAKSIFDLGSDADKKSGRLPDVLGEQEAIAIATRVYDSILSVPRSYYFFFPLPNLKNLGLEEADLTEKVSLVQLMSPDRWPGVEESPSLAAILSRVSMALPELGKTYLRVESVGYARNALSCSAMVSALSRFRSFLIIAESSGVLEKRVSDVPNYGEGSQIIVPCFRSKYTDKEGISIRLPFYISRYINDIRGKGLVFSEDVPPEAKKVVIDSLLSKLKIVDEGAPGDVAPIQAAVDWAFESEVNENETFSFVQACIGLEAILGSDPEKVASSLADRCSYLLGRGYQERETIRKGFLDIYKLRSGLVHGKKGRLSYGERGVLRNARELLRRCINRELEALTARS